MADIKVTADGNVIALNGMLDRDDVLSLQTSMSADRIFILDFSFVSGISFAALRALLNLRRSGQRFSVLNASDTVARKFEDSGVSSFINVCRAPAQIDISQFEEFGAGFLSKTFNSPDGDSMIKVYGPRVPKNIVAQEKMVARAVMVFGIPTPLVGTLYESGENTILDFERIEGKRSFSRIISEEPDRLEEISLKFARMCRKLHDTPCDTGIFSDRTISYRMAISVCDKISEEERKQALAFIDTVPRVTTCLHGDMQLSNVITAGGEDMWIDLSDFGYGYPMLDLGMWYFLSHFNQEEISQNIFHFGNETLLKIWDIFAREYFGTDSKEELEAAEREVRKFAALHMLYIGTLYGFMPFMMPIIRKELF